MNIFIMVGVVVKNKVKGENKMNKSDKLGILISVGSIALATAIVAVDYKTSKWKCRYCENEFKAPLGEYLLAPHTPTRRRLNCPVCGNIGYYKCVRDCGCKENKEEVNTETEIVIE